MWSEILARSTLVFLALTTLTRALPADRPTQLHEARALVQSSVSVVVVARELSLKTEKEVDRLDLEILKRQQGLLTAKRSGNSVRTASDELELSQDRLKLAQARATAAAFGLSLAQTRQTLAETLVRKLEFDEAGVDEQISSLQNELTNQTAQLSAAEQSASLLAKQLETKWGPKLTGKKPELRRVYKADPSQTPEPEEATEL